MPAKLYRKEGDGEWAWIANYDLTMAAVVACDMMNERAKQRGFTSRYRIVKDSDVQAKADRDLTKTLFYAETADEIEEIYKQPVSYSCMYGHYEVRAWAGPDTCVAYMKDKTGTMMARSVIRPAHRVYAYIYRVNDTWFSHMERTFKEMGYRAASGYDFSGVRLAVVKKNGHVVVPSIDVGHKGLEPGWASKKEGEYITLL